MSDYMTYRELAEEIAKLEDWQKDCNVTIYDHYHEDEYYPVQKGLSFATDKNDQLDAEHPIIHM